MSVGQVFVHVCFKSNARIITVLVLLCFHMSFRSHINTSLLHQKHQGEITSHMKSTAGLFLPE